MPCDFCRKRIAVRITQTNDGMTRGVALCAAHAKEFGVNDSAGFSLEKVFMTLRRKHELKKQAIQEPNQ